MELVNSDFIQNVENDIEAKGELNFEVEQNGPYHHYLCDRLVYHTNNEDVDRLSFNDSLMLFLKFKELSQNNICDIIFYDVISIAWRQINKTSLSFLKQRTKRGT